VLEVDESATDDELAHDPIDRTTNRRAVNVAFGSMDTPEVDLAHNTG
jgi:hypothetical protein